MRKKALAVYSPLCDLTPMEELIQSIESRLLGAITQARRGGDYETALALAMTLESERRKHGQDAPVGAVGQYSSQDPAAGAQSGRA